MVDRTTPVDNVQYQNKWTNYVQIKKKKRKWYFSFQMREKELPCTNPLPKRKTEETARAEFEERRSASTNVTKKRKSVTGLSSHNQGDSLPMKPIKSRSAGATSRVCKKLNLQNYLQNTKWKKSKTTIYQHRNPIRRCEPMGDYFSKTGSSQLLGCMFTYERLYWKSLLFSCTGPISRMSFLHKNIPDKKVLLRERKRHTARRVVSPPSVVLPGYPPGRVPPILARGVPCQGGYPTWVPPGRVPPWGRLPPWQDTPPARYPLGRVPPSRVPPW